jgi:hypothetical protein
MPTPHDEYILRSLSKIRHKVWEYFVISRIIHKLDDPDIEFVTQQLVRRPDGSRALTDLFFPQFNLHLEIDESHHFEVTNSGGTSNFTQVLADSLREQDIVDQTGHEIVRIGIFNMTDGSEKPLSTISIETDGFVQRLKSERREREAKGTFVPLDFERRFDPNLIIEKGEISVADNVLFRRQIDAMKCFGFTGAGWMKGAWRIPDGSGDWLWFPKLFEAGMWRNELCDGGRVINERAINEAGRASLRKQRENPTKGPAPNLIVFSKAKDALGGRLFRYVGTFKANFAPEHYSVDNLRFDLVRETEKVRPPLVKLEKIKRDTVVE